MQTSDVVASLVGFCMKHVCAQAVTICTMLSNLFQAGAVIAVHWRT